VPKGPLLRLLSKDAGCAPALLGAFAGCVEEREAALGRLLDREVDRRLAFLFLELAERFGEEDGMGKTLGVRLRHQDLACLVACTREAVSKAIGEFRDVGLIETPRPRAIRVLDEPTLRKLATGRTATAFEESKRIHGDSRGRPRSGLLGGPVVP
jgi:CRP-like cAMP-binding protein